MPAVVSTTTISSEVMGLADKAKTLVQACGCEGEEGEGGVASVRLRPYPITPHLRKGVRKVRHVRGWGGGYGHEGSKGAKVEGGIRVEERVPGIKRVGAILGSCSS